MKIAVGSDHAGYELKKNVLSWLEKHGYDFEDMGPYSAESVDYPDFAHKVAEAVAKGLFDQGILMCGTGIGISIAANKVKGIRAANVCGPEYAALARQHNDANVLAFGARFNDEASAAKILESWFASEFEGGRHQRRIDKIEYCC
ncbi:ribose 5-phosphate isomerase B [Chlorobaculum limnaeum]|uniref:Ribose 5-phosphate isomerase B n=1 Tax=Chlorobaculum limnaeum TaxID=274537 RepID=A0A1D8D5E4_CHLLM|nr:ribose 5-phosphate isomerase B [Chlorobaculum limnaeum]AOS83714.1 ribose 5-phosphate isomerase B [Chlorobaculum limnaeum]